MRKAPYIFIAALFACGSPSSVSDGGGSGKCVAIGSTDYCSAQSPCCNGGYCDPATAFCRDGSSCGTDGQGCDDTHGCCSGNGLACVEGQCTLTSNPTGTTTQGTSGGGCLGSNQFCGSNSDCCSQFCFNQRCATTSGNTTSGNNTTGTNGGTCFSAGAGCSSGTQCCSHSCNNGICG